jgi:hypothetical protein
MDADDQPNQHIDQNKRLVEAQSTPLLMLDSSNLNNTGFEASLALGKHQTALQEESTQLADDGGSSRSQPSQLG